jgi:DNA-binding NarL/FixJ family response regulator
MATKTPIQLLIADDQHLVRRGFRAMLDRLPSMEVVNEAGTLKEAVEQFARHQPDVLLMELRFPDGCGVDAIRAIREQFLLARIIVLTTFDGDEDIYQSFQAGAKAYLLKDITLEELVDCIERVHRGQTCVPLPVAAKLAERMAGPELTDREREVLRRIVAGRSNKEIAADLEITEGTVKTHVNHVLDKLGVHDRTQAATTALRRGLARE